MSFGAQELAGLIRSQLHDRTFELWTVKIVSVEFGRDRGTLLVNAEASDPDDPEREAATMDFEVRIEQMR